MGQFTGFLFGSESSLLEVELLQGKAGRSEYTGLHNGGRGTTCDVVRYIRLPSNSGFGDDRLPHMRHPERSTRLGGLIEATWIEHKNVPGLYA